MSTHQKSESPVSAGLYAERKKTENTMILVPQKTPVNRQADRLDSHARTTEPDAQTLSNTKAAFALRGHVLQRSIRVGDGRITYTASRWNQSRNFSHWNDVLAFLAQIGGAS